VEVVDGPRAEFPGYYDLQIRRGPSQSFMVQRGLWPFEQLENVASISDFLLDRSRSLKRKSRMAISESLEINNNILETTNDIIIIPRSISLVASSFELQPRLYQHISSTPHRDLLYGVRGAPITAKRPLLFLDPVAKMLVEMLAQMVDASIDQVLLRCDALELLIELYTPFKKAKKTKLQKLQK